MDGVKDRYYYDVLGVAPEASTFTIRSRYYVLALQYHPDLAAEDDTELSDKFVQLPKPIKC